MKGLTLKPQALTPRTAKLTLSAIAFALTLGACSTQQPDASVQTSAAPNAVSAQIISQNATNAFFKPYDTFMEIPAFDKIKPEHFLPAFKAGIAKQHEQIQAIVDNKAKPTFANTIEAMEFSGDLVTRVSNVFFNLTGADTNEALQALSKEVSPMLSSAEDDILLNDKLFQKVKAVHDAKDNLKLNTAQAKLLEDKIRPPIIKLHNVLCV